MGETFQIDLDQAKAYEELFVPALFAEWAPRLVETCGIGPGHRVLDVACGTGVVARAAAERTGDPGLVVGVDLNPAMLEVARSVRPDIEWRRGDAAELPFEDSSFDAVLCQSALFFFPDPAAAIREMGRVCRPGGVVGLQTYAELEAQPGYLPLVQAAVRRAGQEARSLLEVYWSQGDLAALTATLEEAGLRVEETRTRLGTARYPSVEAFVDIEVRATPLADRLEEGQVREIVEECEARLAAYRTEHGLDLPIRGHLLAARR